MNTALTYLAVCSLHVNTSERPKCQAKAEGLLLCGTSAVAMQSAQEIALTPALSPEEREKLSCTARYSLINDSFQRGQNRFPLPGESRESSGVMN